MAKRTLKLIVLEERPKHLMKPEMLLKLYLLSKQGQVTEPESFNMIHKDYTEMILQRKAQPFCFVIYLSSFSSPAFGSEWKSQKAILMRSAHFNVNCTPGTAGFYSLIEVSVWQICGCVEDLV